jgi:outer membrane putative beta-barrel porin/alpha-amylase
MKASLGPICCLLLLLMVAVPVEAQELEARALVNTPVGVNFLIVAAGYAHGNLLLDPSLPIKDAKASLGSFVFGYQRSIGVAGLAGKVGLAIPFATGTWEGTIAGVDSSTNRTGFGDPTVKFSLNFVGSPALTLPEFMAYRQSTVAGVSLQVAFPFGQYDPDRLVNLGSNRWTIAPRFGASQTVGRWMFEGYLGATFYTDNNEFYRKQTLSQDPLLDVQTHVIYSIRGSEMWAAASYGYGWGGQSTIQGVTQEPLKNVRVSALVRFPIARGHGLKLVYINGFRTRLGSDFDTFQIAYQHAWGGGI